MNFTTIGAAKKLTGLSYLGGINTSAKIMKNQKYSQQLTYIIYLAPAMQSGYNVCPNSTPECRMGCLATSGRAAMELNTVNGKQNIKNARIAKSRLLFEHPEFFMNWAIAEIKTYQKKAEKLGYGFSVRLNGTSDIDYSKILIDGKNIYDTFPEVNFYDYTKVLSKYDNKPENYHLTFSYSGRNQHQCSSLLEKGYNIAVVFDVKKESDLPAKFMGRDVVNGDLTDYRINDAKGVVIGLKWKKIADKSADWMVRNSFFVVKLDNELCN